MYLLERRAELHLEDVWPGGYCACCLVAALGLPQVESAAARNRCDYFFGLHHHHKEKIRDEHKVDGIFFALEGYGECLIPEEGHVCASRAASFMDETSQCHLVCFFVP